MPAVRCAVLADLPALTAIYNHYVVHTAITFDLAPLRLDQRRPWFDEHAPDGRHRLLLIEQDGDVLGYASSSRWRPKAAYDTTVESSVYVRHDAVGRGLGRQLYAALFDALAREHIHTVVAGVALPNAASMALHERFGFREVGVFGEVGFKFGKFWDVAWLQRRGER
jgi:phosphinothricin acetyltransferase